MHKQILAFICIAMLGACSSTSPKHSTVHVIASCSLSKLQSTSKVFLGNSEISVVSSTALIPEGMHTNTLLFSPLTMSWDVVDKLLIELDNAGFKFQADFFGKYNHAYRDNHIGVYFVEGCEPSMSKQVLTVLR